MTADFYQPESWQWNTGLIIGSLDHYRQWAQAYLDHSWNICIEVKDTRINDEFSDIAK